MAIDELRWDPSTGTLQSSHWKVHFLQNFYKPSYLTRNQTRGACKVPPLGTIVFEAFFVSRQHKRFGFTVFSAIWDFFKKIFMSQKVPSLIIFDFFCTQLDDTKTQNML